MAVAEAVGIRPRTLGIVSDRLRRLLTREHPGKETIVEPTVVAPIVVFEERKPNLLIEPLLIRGQTGEEPSIYLG